MSSGEIIGTNPPPQEAEQPHAISHQQLDEVSRYRPFLLPQATRYITNLMGMAGRSEAEMSLIKGVEEDYFTSRYQRGRELASPKVDGARKLAQLYFNEEVDLDVLVTTLLCMDRRTRKTLVAGLPGGFGRSLRAPGARPEGFRRTGFGGELVLFDDVGSAVRPLTSTIFKRGIYLCIELRISVILKQKTFIFK